MVRKSQAAAAKTEEPDLLAGLQDDTPKKPDEDGLDLLDGLSEDEGTPWMPWDDDDQPAGIQGRVLFRGEVPSDYGPEACPLLEIETADGTVYSIRGYATVLRNQINKVDPQVGDLFAVKYLGERPNKNGKPYHNFKAVAKKA